MSLADSAAAGAAAPMLVFVPLAVGRVRVGRRHPVGSAVPVHPVAGDVDGVFLATEGGRAGFVSDGHLFTDDGESHLLDPITTVALGVRCQPFADDRIAHVVEVLDEHTSMELRRAASNGAHAIGELPTEVADRIPAAIRAIVNFSLVAAQG